MPIAGVVENMSELICPHCEGRSALFGTGGGQRLASELKAPLLGEVPLDAALREAGDSGVPVVSAAPASPSAQALIDVAAALRPARRPLLNRPLGVSPVG
jgi:ATP-binding protein involved in chromosome partitioning